MRDHLGKNEPINSPSGMRVEIRDFLIDKDSRPEQDNAVFHNLEDYIIKRFYNGEFDPGSG